MKASELMIGDLVMAATVITEMRPCRVVSIEGDRDCAGLYDIKDEDKNLVGRYAKHIEPIPLTEEILSSNHFLEDVWESGNEFIREFVYGSFCLRCSGGSFFVHCGNIKIYVLFAHELQHILRLCGYIELADGFKVE